MKREDGGPAFPITVTDRSFDRGMTLLDWFAGQALAGLMACEKTAGPPETFAHAAYRQAAAMLAERKKK